MSNLIWLRRGGMRWIRTIVSALRYVPCVLPTPAVEEEVVVVVVVVVVMVVVVVVVMVVVVVVVMVVVIVVVLVVAKYRGSGP